MLFRLHLRKDILFFICSALLVSGIFCFHYYMAYPGYITLDSTTTLLLVKNNWHPVIMSYLLQGLYDLFGLHVYHLLLMNMVPFYLGIWIIIWTTYKKTVSWWSLLFVFPCFIGTLFYAEIQLGCSTFSISCIWLLYALILYMIVVPHKRIGALYFFTTVVFVITLMSRHNAILQVWPASFIFIGQYLSHKKIEIKGYLGRFSGLAFLCGLVCIGIFFGLAQMLSKADNGQSYPGTQIVAHQIVAACAPELDESCFENEWWTRRWKDNPQKMLQLKQLYEEHPLNSEFFSFYNKGNVPFMPHNKLNGKMRKWFYAFFKYPYNYLKHYQRYYDVLWFIEKKYPTNILRKATRWQFIDVAMVFGPLSVNEYNRYSRFAEKFSDDELYISWSDTQQKIDAFIRKYAPAPRVIWFIGLNFVFFIVFSVLFLCHRQNLLYLYTVTTAFAGIISALVIPLFSPVIFPRYMDPVIVCGLLAIIGGTLAKGNVLLKWIRNIFKRFF